MDELPPHRLTIDLSHVEPVLEVEFEIDPNLKPKALYAEGPKMSEPVTEKEMSLEEWVATLPDSHPAVEQYKEMLKDQRFLIQLQNGGVDNWDGYEYAIDAYEEHFGEL